MKFYVLTSVLCGFLLSPTWCRDYTPIHEENRCALRGSCMKSGASDQPCVNQTEPQPVDDDEATSILESLCPNFYVNNEDPAVCCDASQIISLKSNMAVPSQLLSQCPACYRNFLELWCAYTCDPNQSQFVDVTRAKEYGDEMSAEEMTVYWDQSYVDTMYDSCVGVQFAGMQFFQHT